VKAGLFMCDHVMSGYQSEYGDYSDMFMNLFSEYDWVLYDVYNGEYPEDLNECDVYFITGSKHSVYEDIEWIKQLKELILELYNRKKFVIGFCFGHQLIGEALGGTVAKSPNGWNVGVHTFDVIQKEDWMNPLREDFNVLMMCQDQILELPENTKVLASSEMCPNAIIMIGKTFLGIQGHPEFSKEYDEMLMRTRMNGMGSHVAFAGIKSLDKEVHSELLKKWVMQFLKSH